MNLWIVVSGMLIGLAVAVLIGELVPAGPSLRAAFGRLEARSGPARPVTRPRELARSLSASLPWLPVPVTDLRLLGQEVEDWMAVKVALGIAGLAAVPVLSGLLSLSGHALPWTIPVAGSLGLGLALFFAPDLVTRVNAAEKRRDFRHALTSYLDLVVLERGAGAAPTEALEAAADVGDGWAFQRIAAALNEARKASLPPWEGLGRLATEIGIPELSDLAEIASIAGNEGARILDTLSARADSMRAEALAATKAQAGSRSTTMVVPIAMLAAGFLILLIFPDFYRIFG